MHFQNSIKFSHPDFVVAHKPADVSFHTEEGIPGFASQLQAQWGETLYPVHRLDRITSGLILFARTPQAARELGALFEQGEIAKFYLAISDQKPSKKQGMIKGMMSKGRNGSWKLTRDHGVVAVTQFFSFSIDAGLRVFVVRLRTGRTHQIRVALKSLGSPLLGDARYGGTAADRGYLHAWALRFSWKGETLCFTAPPDEGDLFKSQSLSEKLQEIGAPWALDWPRWHKPKPLADND